MSPVRLFAYLVLVVSIICHLCVLLLFIAITFDGDDTAMMGIFTVSNCFVSYLLVLLLCSIVLCLNPGVGHVEWGLRGVLSDLNSISLCILQPYSFWRSLTSKTPSVMHAQSSYALNDLRGLHFRSCACLICYVLTSWQQGLLIEQHLVETPRGWFHGMYTIVFLLLGHTLTKS